MNKNKILEKLEALYNLGEVRKGFASQKDCIDWCNKVAPLLKFNHQYYYIFLFYLRKMNLQLSSLSLEPTFNIMTSQVQMAIEELKIDLECDTNDKENLQKVYIDETRIQELMDITNRNYDLLKLIQILNELNTCYEKNCYISVILLTRALIDHVPPIFNCSKFSEVANNYNGSQSFKGSMQNLEKSSRKIADQYLHCRIRNSETLLNKTQIDFSNDIDVLLSEIVRILK